MVRGDKIDIQFCAEDKIRNLEISGFDAAHRPAMTKKQEPTHEP
jgi:hypothetical protein